MGGLGSALFGGRAENSPGLGPGRVRSSALIKSSNVLESFDTMKWCLGGSQQGPGEPKRSPKRSQAKLRSPFFNIPKFHINLGSDFERFWVQKCSKTCQKTTFLRIHCPTSFLTPKTAEKNMFLYQTPPCIFGKTLRLYNINTITSVLVAKKKKVCSGCVLGGKRASILITFGLLKSTKMHLQNRLVF